MSDQQEHGSLIRTPKQLIIACVLALVVPVGLALLGAQFVTVGRKGVDSATEERTAAAILPVARVELNLAGGASKGPKTGEQIYQSVCSACHGSGAAGAPKVGDAGAWGPRIGKGLDGLVKSAAAGKGAMPPKGGAADLTDADLARAIAYMANKSGASFKEPAMPAAGAKGGDAKADGKAVYEKTCGACHASGAAGAPKFGDKAAWAPRVKGGMDALLGSALKGKNGMPPKGGNAALSDAEVKAAMEYMVNAAK